MDQLIWQRLWCISWSGKDYGSADLARVIDQLIWQGWRISWSGKGYDGSADLARVMDQLIWQGLWSILIDKIVPLCSCVCVCILRCVEEHLYNHTLHTTSLTTHIRTFYTNLQGKIRCEAKDFRCGAKSRWESRLASSHPSARPWSCMVWLKTRIF